MEDEDPEQANLDEVSEGEPAEKLEIKSALATEPKHEPKAAHEKQEKVW